MSEWRSVPGGGGAALSRGWSIGALVVAVCLAAYLPTLAPGVTWANEGADSGDLIAAAVTGGVAHPTGYPTYLLLARLFLLLPPGDPAQRVTLISPLAAALTALAVFDMLRRWLSADGRRAEVAGLLAALSIGLAPLFWSQAVIAEVYTLGALFVAMLLRATLLALREPQPAARRGTRLTAVLAGLALGNHLTVLPFVLIWAAVVCRAQGLRARLGSLTRLGIWVGAGLLVYLYLPLSARGNPPINWGDPAQAAGFWWLVSGQFYSGLLFALPAAQIGPRSAAWAALLVEQFSWPGVLLGCWGLVAGGRPERGLVWLMLGLAALYSLFAIGYNSVDSSVYLIPTHLIFAVWVGLGASDLLGAAARAKAALAPAATLALAALLLYPALATRARVDASRDRRAIDYAAMVLARAPAGALLLTADGRGTFPLWYYHFGLRQRDDLHLVAVPLLDFAWYRESLLASYPELRLPEAAPRGWEAALAAWAGPSKPICRASAEPVPRLECQPARSAHDESDLDRPVAIEIHLEGQH